MRVLFLSFCLSTLASAFMTQQLSHNVMTPRLSDAVDATVTAHRNRRATIVMDGKANGTSS